MINKILNFFYLNNYFRLAIYFLKILSFLDNKYKKKISFYNYFKKKKNMKNKFYKYYIFPEYL